MEEQNKLGIYTVVYGKLSELHSIKLDKDTDPILIREVCNGIAYLAEILAEGKRMRNPKE